MKITVKNETHGSKAGCAIAFFRKEINAKGSGTLVVVEDIIIDSTSIAAHIAQDVVE